MNPCPRYEESIIFHSYHALGRKKVITLQKHLSQCERCRGYLDGWEHVLQVIQTHDAFHSDPFLDIQW